MILGINFGELTGGLGGLTTSTITARGDQNEEYFLAIMRDPETMLCR